MSRYKIEIYVLGKVSCSYETDDYAKARKYYWLHNDLDECWTKLYIDGESGTKAWMDRQMRHTPNLTAYFRKDR